MTPEIDRILRKKAKHEISQYSLNSIQDKYLVRQQMTRNGYWVITLGY